MLGPVALACFAAAGCDDRIDTVYGQRQGHRAATSVNGTAVLGKMFQQAGHNVFSWRNLSPRLRERADCIVWFPDDFEPPSGEVRGWLEDWLSEKSGRTLIYVGRDFDAAPGYWETIRPGAPADQQAEIGRRLIAARDQAGLQRGAPSKPQDCSWFTLDDRPSPRQVRSLQGDAQWRRDINPAQLEIELVGRMLPAPQAEVLLESEGDMLLSRELWEGRRLIVVVNGSFLLNLPLVDHQHRELAGKLIDEVGQPGRTVVFLESSSGGPPIREEDPPASAPTGLEIFNLWPTNWILLHLAVAGIIFCFSRCPIFGRPRQLRARGPSDFGEHIRALAELLRQTGDRAYATARLLHYQQTTRPGE